MRVHSSTFASTVNDGASDALSDSAAAVCLCFTALYCHLVDVHDRSNTMWGQEDIVDVFDQILLSYIKHIAQVSSKSFSSLCWEEHLSGCFHLYNLIILMITVP